MVAREPQGRAALGRLTPWGAKQIARRLEAIAGSGDPVLAWQDGELRARPGTISKAIEDTLVRAGLGSEPGVRPLSVVGWVGATVLEETGRIDAAALRMGMRSLDRAARIIGWDWREAARGELRTSSRSGTGLQGSRQARNSRVILSNPGLFRLADLIPTPERERGGCRRIYPDYTALVYEVLISVYGSARQVEAELSHPLVWRFMRRLVKKMFPGGRLQALTAQAHETPPLLLYPESLPGR